MGKSLGEIVLGDYRRFQSKDFAAGPVDAWMNDRKYRRTMEHLQAGREETERIRNLKGFGRIHYIITGKID